MASSGGRGGVARVGRGNGRRGLGRAGIGAVLGVLVLAAAGEARADDATVTVGGFAPPPDGRPRASSSSAPIATDPDDDGERPRSRPDLRRSAVRFQLGPSTVTTGKSLGLGVGLGVDIGTGSVGGRLSAGWLRGEGTTDGGASTPTGNLFSHYGGEITLDFLKRGPWHPVLGMGIALVHVSRPDANSGFAGAGTGRVGLEYALGLEDADVRIGASASGGLVGPVDDEISDLRGYALVGAHLGIGF